MIRDASVLTLSLLLLSSYTAQSLRFDIKSGHTKCVAEDIKSKSLTVGKYSIVNPNEGQPLPDSHKINVRVNSAYGNNYHTADRVESGQFAFTAPENGDYRACFWAPDHKPELTFSVDFEWKSGMEAKDWTNVAKKGSVDAMEQELNRLFDIVSSINEEMYDLRDRDDGMQELNKSTNSQNGRVQSSFPCRLSFRRQPPVLALEDLFRKEEVHLSIYILHIQILYSAGTIFF